MFAILIGILGHFGLQLLGAFFATAAESAKSAGFDSNHLQYIKDLVASADSNTTLDTPDKKYEWVYQQAKDYLIAQKLSIGTSLLNSVIELAVHHTHNAGS